MDKVLDQRLDARIVEQNRGWQVMVERTGQTCRQLDGRERVDVDQIDVGAVAVAGLRDAEMFANRLHHARADI
jgi:hypothetical protein